MRNLFMHPTSYPDQNLSKTTWRYIENKNRKNIFFFSSSKINKYYFIILTVILLIFLGGPFLVEISSNLKDTPLQGGNKGSSLQGGTWEKERSIYSLELTIMTYVHLGPMGKNYLNQKQVILCT